jgi:hypothetical protein
MTCENHFSGDNNQILQVFVEVHIHPPQLPQDKQKPNVDIGKLVLFLKPIWWIVQHFIWIIPVLADFTSYFFNLIS